MNNKETKSEVKSCEAYFPGPSGTLAWTLEHQAHGYGVQKLPGQGDRMLEMLGHGPHYKQVQMAQEAKRQMGARLVPILQVPFLL